MHPKSTKKLRFKATKIEKGFETQWDQTKFRAPNVVLPIRIVFLLNNVFRGKGIVSY